MFASPPNLPKGTLSALRTLAQLEAQLPQVVKNKNLPVIMVCQVGGRASRAAAQAQKLGFERAQALSGGLKSWREANLPVEKA